MDTLFALIYGALGALAFFVASKATRPSSEKLAQKFHETYERLAPEFDYKTRIESAVSWDEVPDRNKNLMIAVCREVFGGRLLND